VISKAPAEAMEIVPALSTPPASAKVPALMVSIPLGLLEPPVPASVSVPPPLSETIAPLSLSSKP